MPPKQSITRDLIITSGITLARKKGIESLSARTLAKTLNCSTQPIYSCFSTMKELEQTILTEALRVATATYLIKPDAIRINFLDIGLGYLCMAKKDPHLYDMLYTAGHADVSQWIFPIKQDVLLDAMEKDEMLCLLDRPERLKILTHMAVYTHGLVMLGRINPDLEQAYLEAELEEMGRIVIANTLMEKGVPDHENPCLKRKP